MTDQLPSNDSEANETDLDGESPEESEEFSLERLTKAYARVLKGEGAGSEPQPKSALNNSTEEGPPDITTPDAGEQNPSEDSQPDDNCACPISPESIVESILFVGAPKDVKLTNRKIAAVLRDVSPKEVSKIVKQLNARYETEQAVFRIKNFDGNLKMVLHESLNPFQQEFFGRNKQARLSQTAIDVMAVVAYNQPVTREQVEQVRAKSSGKVLTQLVKRKLLYILPPDDDAPKSKLYGTTDRFLDFFNLAEIADLPQSHDVSDIDELSD